MKKVPFSGKKKFYAIGKFMQNGDWRILVSRDTDQVMVFNEEEPAHAALELAAQTYDMKNYVVKEVARPDPKDI
jgi:hypothetical protein